MPLHPLASARRREAQYLILHGSLNPDLLQIVLVHAGEHSHGQDEQFGFAAPGGVHCSAEHLGAASGMNR